MLRGEGYTNRKRRKEDNVIPMEGTICLQLRKTNHGGTKITGENNRTINYPDLVDIVMSGKRVLIQ